MEYLKLEKMTSFITNIYHNFQISYVIIFYLFEYQKFNKSIFVRLFK